MKTTVWDALFLEQFEQDAIEPDTFRHRDHVRAAWLMVRQYGRVEAGRRLARRLAALAARAGKADRFDAALTAAWVGAIAGAMASHPEAADFAAFADTCPELLDRNAVARMR